MLVDKETGVNDVENIFVRNSARNASLVPFIVGSRLVVLVCCFGRLCFFFCFVFGLISLVSLWAWSAIF